MEDKFDRFKLYTATTGIAATLALVFTVFIYVSDMKKDDLRNSAMLERMSEQNIMLSKQIEELQDRVADLEEVTARNQSYISVLEAQTQLLRDLALKDEGTGTKEQGP